MKIRKAVSEVLIYEAIPLNKEMMIRLVLNFLVSEVCVL